MRITDNMQLTQAIAGQQTASTNLYALSAEASSGKKIVNPSDNPAGYAQVVSTTAQISRMNARQTTISTTSSDLTTADGALASAGGAPALQPEPPKTLYKPGRELVV